jgi:hypothetical protein
MSNAQATLRSTLAVRLRLPRAAVDEHAGDLEAEARKIEATLSPAP